MHNEAADLLTRNAKKIMKNWEERSNNEVLAAYKLESLVLRDSLPELLEQISDALSTTIDRTAARIRADRKDSLRIGKKHGQERATSSDYTMDQMIFEYHILREVICDVMEEERPLSQVEREVIVCAIEQSVNDAATEFSATLRSIQQKLASTLTHDLRGPIIVAKMSAEFIVKKPENVEHTLVAAKRICQSMERVMAMIQELLDASLLRAGKTLPLEIEEFDLGELIAKSAEEFNLVYCDRVKVVTKSSQIGFWSKSGLRRVLENLVTNAIKYGGADTPVTITLGATDSKVQVSVHNEGKPIALADQPTLFEQFRRIETSRTKSGWGIGLTVVKGVTEAHGGTVHLESSESKGTTFMIELPIDARMVVSKEDNEETPEVVAV